MPTGARVARGCHDQPLPELAAYRCQPSESPRPSTTSSPAGTGRTARTGSEASVLLPCRTALPAGLFDGPGDGVLDELLGGTARAAAAAGTADDRETAAHAARVTAASHRLRRLAGGRSPTTDGQTRGPAPAGRRTRPIRGPARRPALRNLSLSMRSLSLASFVNRVGVGQTIVCMSCGYGLWSRRPALRAPLRIGLILPAPAAPIADLPFPRPQAGHRIAPCGGDRVGQMRGDYGSRMR